VGRYEQNSYYRFPTLVLASSGSKSLISADQFDSAPLTEVQIYKIYLNTIITTSVKPSIFTGMHVHVIDFPLD